MPRWRRLFRLPLRRDDLARDEMDAELAFHLEARVEQLVARGFTPDAARAEALRKFGGSLDEARRTLRASATHKERTLSMRERLDDILSDVRFALRGLARRPAFTAVAVATLALGIGANTAIFSAVDALLLRSLPFAAPERLMLVVQRSPEGGDMVWSWPRFRAFRELQHSFASMALYSDETVTLTGTDPERVRIENISAAYLKTLGIAVARGRDFPDAVDAGPNARRLVLIGDALWRRRFGAAPDVVGRTLDIQSDAYEIAGVLPPSFRGASGGAEAWIPIGVRPAGELNEPMSLEFTLIGRLRDGATFASAATEASGLASRLDALFPRQAGTLTTSASTSWGIAAHPLDDARIAPLLKRSLLVLFGAVGMVLLIACVNLANLFLGRASVRRQEIAIRLAIGAGRARLVRLLITESLALSLIGGAAGVLLAWWGAHVLASLNPQDALRAQGLASDVGAAGFEGIRLDGRAFGFAFAVSLAVGIVFGLVPALQATRVDLSESLKSGTGGSGHGARIGASRRLLVVAEVTLAVVLLAGAGLMMRSLQNVLDVNPGFDASHLLTLRLSVPPGVTAPDSMPGFYEQVQGAVAALPGVQRVALADCAPVGGGCNGTVMVRADQPPSTTGNAMVGVHWVSASWFGALRVPLVRGRLFDATDRIGTPKVVLINEAAARAYFADGDPIGKIVKVYQGGFHTGATVIGIVGDVHFGTVAEPARPDVFISYGQARVPRMMIFARTAGEPAALAASARRALKAIAPLDPVYDVRSMTERMADGSAQARFSALLLMSFAAVALALAAMGIFGVLSFAVAQRTREIGIRMALGADRSRVMLMVLREGTGLALGGIVLGTGAALALSRVLRSMLFGVTPQDPATYVTIVAVVALAALAATWFPARRATGVDPVDALREG